MGMETMETVRHPTVAHEDDFGSFVAATAARLHRTAVLLCHDHHLAEDLTQTTYAKLFASWHRVKASSNPVAYARTTLLRTYFSQQRRRSSTERPSDALPELPVPEPDHPRRLDLMRALAELSPRDRAVLVLRYWEDLSVAETAQVLGLKEPTCRARAARALTRLRHHFPDLEDLS